MPTPAFRDPSLENVTAQIDAMFAKRPPLARPTQEQMAAARAAAYAVRRFDGLLAGERIVNGEIYVFNADARNADIDAALATQAMERAA